MKGKNFFWGSYFILISVAIILQLFNVAPDFPFINWIVVIAAIPLVLYSIMKLSYFGIFMPIAIGLYMFSEQLGIKAFSDWKIFLIAILLSIGCHILFKKKERWSTPPKHNPKPGEVYVGEDFYERVAFAETTKYITSSNFNSGNLSSSFGCLNVYFDHSDLPNQEAYLNCESSFGAIRLYVPKDWDILCNISPKFVGVSGIITNKHAVNRLHLTGAASFGAVEVHYI